MVTHCLEIGDVEQHADRHEGIDVANPSFWQGGMDLIRAAIEEGEGPGHAGLTGDLRRRCALLLRMVWQVDDLLPGGGVITVNNQVDPRWTLTRWFSPPEGGSHETDHPGL